MELKLALAGSEIRERKLHFASYMHGRGARIRSAMHSRAQVSPDSFAHLMLKVRETELYMPVLGHRERWRGEAAVLVAVALDDFSHPVGYSLSGTRQVLNQEQPPATPTIVLAPVETDFAVQIPRNLAGRAAALCPDRPDRTVEETAAICVPVDIRAEHVAPTFDRLPSTGGPAEGVFATFFRIIPGCGGECWAWGDPEYEVHVLGRQVGGDTAFHVLQCAGEHPLSQYQPGNQSADYAYDQNGKFWTGRVQLLNRAQVDQRIAVDSGQTMFQLWEDDYRACKIEDDKNRLAWFAKFTRDTFLAVGLAIGIMTLRPEDPPSFETVIAILATELIPIFSLIANLPNMIVGDDDYIGMLVKKSVTPYANDFPDNTHIIYHKDQFAGRATLKGFIANDPAARTVGAVTSVEVSPNAITLDIGYAQQFSAQGYDALHQPAPGVAAWQSSNPSVAAVSSNGLVSGLAEGEAVITGTINGVSSSATVRAVPRRLLVSIEGPLEVSPGGWCGYYANTNGASSYATYEWRLNDIVVGNGGDLQLSPTAGSHILKVVVEDGDAVATGSAGLLVQSGFYQCGANQQ
ncbi:MAG: Ig-like domain-containing protein [Gemmatimonadaceae bacterium]